MLYMTEGTYELFENFNMLKIESALYLYLSEIDV